MKRTVCLLCGSDLAGGVSAKSLGFRLQAFFCRDEKVQPVVLQTAFFFSCPKCHNDNFVAAVEAELTDEEREEAFRDYYDLESWQELPDNWKDFGLVWQPEHVQCLNCGEGYVTCEETGSSEGWW